MPDELVFETAPDKPNVNPGAWVDRSADVRTPSTGDQLVGISRGRDDELSIAEAGTASIVLDNSDRAYDPRVSAIRTWWHARLTLSREGAADLPLFRGFIEGIDQAHVEAEDRFAQLSLVDATRWFAGENVELFTRPQELSGARINAVLDAVGWPAGLRNISPGFVVVDELIEADGTALEFMREAAEVEYGLLLINPLGQVDFADRQQRLDLTSSLTIETTEATEQAGVWNDDLLVNVARMELSDGQQRTHKDQASIDIYGERLYSDPDLPTLIVESEAAGMWAVFRYATEHERIQPVRFRITDFTSPLLDVEIGELVTLQRRWPDATVDNLLLVVEGVEDSATPADWKRTWRLSPWWGGEDWLVVSSGADEAEFGLDEGVLAP